MGRETDGQMERWILRQTDIKKTLRPGWSTDKWTLTEQNRVNEQKERLLDGRNGQTNGWKDSQPES